MKSIKKEIDIMRNINLLVLLKLIAVWKGILNDGKETDISLWNLLLEQALF